MVHNPFTPFFGETPAHLAGRDHLIRSFERAFAEPTRRPELASIFSGARGTGKTSILTYLARRAPEWGWVSVDVTCTAGMLDEIEVQTRRRIGGLSSTPNLPKVKGLGVAGLVELEFDERTTTWRSRMTSLVEKLANDSRGLLITVDELNPSLPELEILVTSFQHFVREDRRVALLMAGLPSKVDRLLAGDATSFLRRANHVALARIGDADVESALLRTVRDGGRDIEPSALASATKAIYGFPYFLQLLGFFAWDAEPDAPVIEEGAVATGIRLGRARLRSGVFDATWRDLSDNDRAFLEAMLEDGAESSMAQMQQRLNWSKSLVAQYRRRLIAAGVIAPTRRGHVAIELPYFRQFLEEELGEG